MPSAVPTGSKPPAGAGAKTAGPEIVIPFPVPREQIAVATEYASSGVTTSLVLLRERGLYDQYLRHLPAEHRDAILSLVPGLWVPMEVGMIHYRAVEAIGIPREDAIELGAQSSARLYSPAFQLAAKLASGAGVVSPWAVMRKLPESWSRTLRGGSAVSALKLGPKEGRLEMEGYPLAELAYIRAALVGIIRQPISLFCRKVVVRELPRLNRPNAIAYQISWV